MQQIRLLLHLLEKEFSFRSIASQIRLSRQTVTHYAEKLNNSQQTFENLRNLSDNELAAIVYSTAQEDKSTDNARLHDFKMRLDYLLSELKRTGVTRLLLWEEYRKVSDQPYGYTQFCILFRSLLPMCFFSTTAV